MERLTSRVFQILLLLTALCVQGQAQNPTQSQQQQADDVLRIKTELVQSDVMVFDKQGHFVDGLRPEQFELTVDGKPQPISFFEQVKAGSYKETAQLAAATNNSAPSEKTMPTNDSRGRTIVFFIDDLHLSLDSLARTRKTLAHFIENEMNDNDRVAIATCVVHVLLPLRQRQVAGPARPGFDREIRGNRIAAVWKSAAIEVRFVGVVEEWNGDARLIIRDQHVIHLVKRLQRLVTAQVRFDLGDHGIGIR